MITIGEVAVSSMVIAQSRSEETVEMENYPALSASKSTIGQSYLGPAGINARILHSAPYNLLGRKIAIGQVEPGRPGVFGFDKNIPVPTEGLRLAGLFFRDRFAKSNTFLDAHAHAVASIMVGQDKTTWGVAPAARLYSSAMGTRQVRGGQPEECMAVAHVARQNGGDVRAINLSFGESFQLDQRDLPILDGNAFLTHCLDWLAQETNTLFSVAGNQGKGGIPIPTDHFNGVTVAYTRSAEYPDGNLGQDGLYNKVDFANLGDELAGVAYRFIGYERNLADRSSVSLVAPGRQLKTLQLRGGYRRRSGTSFAAPQVTAAVALLQEYGDRRLVTQLKNPDVHSDWSLASRRHEVMKAVLLNSTDKLQEQAAFPGNRLGMTKTIRSQTDQDWLSSRAYYNQRLPLDPLFGAGQLNLLRAYQQFSAGQFAPDSSTIPIQGWDYNQVAVEVQAETSETLLPSYRDYPISSPLRRGCYFAATLTWDRAIELVDRDGDGQYSLGDRFAPQDLNDLNLYLLPADEDLSSRSTWSSRSTVDSVEHIFHRIPKTGRYKLRVEYERQGGEALQDYALAWWGAADAPAAAQ